MRVARQVSHHNVCRVYDIGEVDGRHFLSMEFIKGEELSSLLRRIGRLPQDKAIQIARQICAGLAAAHDVGVLHRDLKPANIMIDGDGNARITDFGLAVWQKNLREEEVRAGTPAYMSPEQLEGKELTVQSDIYSLGLVLYELFTGKRAFEAPIASRVDQSAPQRHYADDTFRDRQGSRSANRAGHRSVLAKESGRRVQLRRCKSPPHFPVAIRLRPRSPPAKRLRRRWLPRRRKKARYVR